MFDLLSLKKIGEVSVIENPSTVTLTMTRDKQAQQMIPTIPKIINDINPTLLQIFEIPKGDLAFAITGCTIMPTGKIVFVDNENHRLVIHNENGLFVCEIQVSKHPVDVTCIDDNTVAVTHYTKPYHIEIINIENKKIVKRINTSNKCFGITNKCGKLIYYETGSGIQTVDIADGSSINTVVKVDGEPAWNYVTASNDKIFHTNPDSDTVTCYTVTGQKVLEYKNESSLQSFCGVTIDNDSNVYVAPTGVIVSSYYHLMERTFVNC